MQYVESERPVLFIVSSDTDSVRYCVLGSFFYSSLEQVLSINHLDIGEHAEL